MRFAIYHRPRAWPVAALLWATGCTAWAADPEVGATLAEAWVDVATPEDLRAVEALGVTLAEGRRPLPGGGYAWRILGTKRALDAIAARGLPVRVDRDDHLRGAPAGAWHAPEQGDALLHELAGRSRRAGVAQLGTSVQGRPILGMWIGAAPDSGAPSVRVLGAHHGDEWSSFEVALDLAAVLVERDGADAAVTAFLDATTVWIVPYVNPDGVAAGSRYNAHDVDLNRNYDFEWSRDAFRGGPSAFSEPETRAVRTHALWSVPYASLSLHAGDTNIGYVWNYTTRPTPEEALLVELARDYDAACTAPGFWVTNGADWYITRGDTNDWSYGRLGGMDFTVELTSEKTPSEADIPTFLEQHRAAVLGFVLRAPDLRGRVVDAGTGAPVAARLRVLPAAGEPSAWFVTDPVAGTYARISAAAASVEVTAPGYATVVVDAAPELTIALPRAGLADGIVLPRMLRAGADALELPLPYTGGGHLERPGFAAVPFDAVDGVAPVDGAALAPGAWTVALDDGTAWPRAVFGPEDRLEPLLSGATLTVDLPLGAGTRAYALWGDARPFVPLPVVAETASTVVIDLSGVPSSGDLDVLVVSNGEERAMPDVYDLIDEPVDTGIPRDTAEDTGDVAVIERPVLTGGCGCDTRGAGGAAGLALLVAVPLMRRRRASALRGSRPW